jgi:serine protease AprX
VRSGVVVVVAAGNSGYGYQQTSYVGVKAAGLLLSINDPGNAEAAITVGSTHREMPHLYGASFFSSKGPTGDGRNKPDILAPGEKIVSCAAGTKKAAMLEHGRSASSPAGATEAQVLYIEDSGTSMAAPHVSGAIAAFLSVRREFQGQPERVKQLFLDNATDLNRERYFQGRGLVDLMRTIQSV